MERQAFFWGHSKRYNDFPTYFRSKFQERVQKVSVDAGFTCPNRDGTKGKGGCSYCNNKTFKPSYCNLETSVTNQINQGVEFFARKYKSMRFLAYFQAYSSTYASLENLKELYEEALAHPKIVGLVIATRPDCLDHAVLDYFEELSKKFYVMVELGIESHLDSTLERINRGHTFQDSIIALEETRKHGINNCAHLILGLPGESKEDILEQSRTISKLPIDNLKLHQLQIHKGTVLEKQYYQSPNEFNLFKVEEYIDLVVDYLELLNPAIVVERFISQAPPELLVAPRWGLKNFEFVAKVEKRLNERKTWQGRWFEKD
ncbi:MAG: TIGR01212 family radical SAM protein [Mariniphaga sp.]|nr:TIGR01212 family radical SAM protein [Mariniphaga sp.]